MTANRAWIGQKWKVYLVMENFRQDLFCEPDGFSQNSAKIREKKEGIKPAFQAHRGPWTEERRDGCRGRRFQ